MENRTRIAAMNLAKDSWGLLGPKFPMEIFSARGGRCLPALRGKPGLEYECLTPSPAFSVWTIES